MRKIVIISLLLLLLLLPMTAVAEDDIVLVPLEPLAGKNLIFYLPNSNGTANGYIICGNNNVHLIEISNNLGMVVLDREDCGNATVKIFAGNVTYSKTFQIKPFFEGDLVIESPPSTLIDTDVTIKVVIGPEPASGATVKFTSLTGRTFSRVVGDSGTIVTPFDEKGAWTIKAEVYGTTASTSINVLLPPLKITLSADIEVNKEMKISVGESADVTIRKNEITWDYRTDANGNLYFTPPWPGRYTIEAAVDGREGEKSFVTISETRIDVYDYEKSIPISTIKKDQRIEIVVVDPAGVPVSEIEELFVYCDGSLWDTMPLKDGRVVWAATKEAVTYRFSVEEAEGYQSSEVTLYRITEEPFLGDSVFYVVLVAIIFVIILLMAYLHRTGRLKGIGILKRRGLKGKLSGIIPRSKKLE